MSRPRCDVCRKRSLPDQESAFAAAIRLSARFGRAYRAYQCFHGQGWHLTTNPLREQTG